MRSKCSHRVLSENRKGRLNARPQAPLISKPRNSRHQNFLAPCKPEQAQNPNPTLGALILRTAFTGVTRIVFLLQVIILGTDMKGIVSLQLSDLEIDQRHSTFAIARISWWSRLEAGRNLGLDPSNALP